MAVNATLLPTVTTEPVTGAVIVAVGAVAATAVTLTAGEVVEFPLLSVTRAVSEKLDAPPGTQVVV